jgi:uncharacterized membrane protein YedE/YeeE
MSDGNERQAIVDEEHLKLLSLGYMISAGMAALFALFGLLYVGMGVVMGLITLHGHVVGDTQPGPPAFVGWVVAGFGWRSSRYSPRSRC